MIKEINGYPSSNFLGHKYITLNTKTSFSQRDAWKEFEKKLSLYLGKYDVNNATLIWRRWPTIYFEEEYPECISCQKCYVTARLTVYPKNIFKILKKKKINLDQFRNSKFEIGHNITHNILDLSEKDWKQLLEQ